ncbi:BTAD domain-containing putative transcriptional regulator [Nonomuraea sp. PA05]|uniref:BTAD domain-containing putative transcriptional regulator n=1 Tax=Nonomuraea sp. PA05 TaxID=2604466 RepID=UPI001651C51C|nr:BTAD domain-containing putative transcriptional regulator [Nonomuraea sp. PA05]
MIVVRFSVLGPLAVFRDGRRTAVPGGKIRTVLATLLLRPNEVVTVDHFAERLWDERIPRNPRRVLQTNVARLRQSLDLGELIQTEPGGYLARLRADQLDLLQFRHLVQQADHAADAGQQEGRLLHEALRLWRGPACADVESDTLHRIDVPPLAEQRLQVLERRIDADLQAGEHAALTAELRALTAEHPLRERFWAQLMTALYRGGRQAEALGAYRTISRLLRDELGIDPNTELRWLHRAVLTQERLVPRAARPTPRQLPADVAGFAGRERELAVLDGICDASAAMVTAVEGMAGVGKTALAVHAAHRLAPAFPDGQLFIDLHGHTPAGAPDDLGYLHGHAPGDPAGTLGRVLTLLGVPAEAVPRQLADRAALYRSVLAGRKMLIVLDDAAGEDQIRPLLPGAGACRVLVTSRRRLLDLDGARTVPVDVLPEPDAIALFTAAAGAERVAGAPRAPDAPGTAGGLGPLGVSGAPGTRGTAASEGALEAAGTVGALGTAGALGALGTLGVPGALRDAREAREAVAEVVRRCGLLPLAIHLAAARLQAHPAWSVRHLLERLESRGRRLSELRAGRRSVAAALDLSYRDLTPAGRRAYRLLGLHPSAEIVPESAAALLSTTVAGASASLERLLELHLLGEPAPGRYRFHELVRAHATERAVREESEEDRRAALTRLFHHYSRAASAAMSRQHPCALDAHVTRPATTGRGR